ncbi:unnamed protein product [Linum tenue]|nr:unnamed protein product [Linum tenue]
MELRKGCNFSKRSCWKKGFSTLLLKDALEFSTLLPLFPSRPLIPRQR